MTHRPTGHTVTPSIRFGFAPRTKLVALLQSVVNKSSVRQKWYERNLASIRAPFEVVAEADIA